LVNGIRFAQLDFVVTVGSTSGAPADLEARTQKIRSAFASYAHEDRSGVLARIQGIQKVLPSLDIFLDVLTLRSGQKWELELYRRIPASDIFYLFWSRNAKASSWVEKEWRCAYESKGLDFVDPIPLESPVLAPPPPELASKHFDDALLYVLRDYEGK
jgi:hypothetical protein